MHLNLQAAVNPLKVLATASQRSKRAGQLLRGDASCFTQTELLGARAGRQVILA